MKKTLCWILGLILVVSLFAGCTWESTDSRFLSARSNKVDLKELTTNLSTAKRGDRIYFGSWEQDSEKSNGPELLSWTVLDRQPGKVLVLTDYVLDRRLFAAFDGYTLWPECSLRTWLNDTFYKEAFTSAERELIRTSTNVSLYYEDKSQVAVESEEKVFLLSADEQAKYVIGKGTLGYGIPTPMVKSEMNPDRITKLEGVLGVTETISWWLRDAGTEQNMALIVNASTGVYGSVGLTADSLSGIRPAVWLTYDEELASAYEAGTAVLPEDEELNEKIKNANVGDVITFGTYDVDPTSKNGYEDLEWLVLESEDDAVLLILKKVFMQYVMYEGSDSSECVWSTSLVREFLNDPDFIKTMFTAWEQAKIIPFVHVTNGVQGTERLTEETRDYLFVPSKEEIVYYFKTDAEMESGNNGYWLRSPAGENEMMYVYSTGGISSKDPTEYSGIRMMMWVAK